ncbi:MAG: lptC [Burkholderiales bacterium]|jgi:LPS export ABC transporter protein LptC|nr:lptC [Burkholderiales bacterium]
MHKFYSSRTFTAFAMIIMGVLCLLLDTLTRINFNKIELPKNSPEYNAKGVNGSVYNKNGKLQYNLKSNTAWQFPEDKRIYMEMMDIKMYNESNEGIKYDLTSDDGWVNHSSKLGYLGKNTELVVEDANPRKITRIFASAVDLDLNKNIFKSNEDVKAIQDKNILTGHGFSYDRDRQFLEINSKVKIIYYR